MRQIERRCSDGCVPGSAVSPGYLLDQCFMWYRQRLHVALGDEDTTLGLVSPPRLFPTPRFRFMRVAVPPHVTKDLALFDEESPSSCPGRRL